MNDSICPGKLLGEASVFILISTLLATLNVSSPPEGLEWNYEKQLVWYVPCLCLQNQIQNDRETLFVAFRKDLGARLDHGPAGLSN